MNFNSRPHHDKPALPSARIRAARVDEAQRLSDLARLAKAYWNYSPADLQVWASSLRITGDSILEQPTFVAEIDSRTDNNLNDKPRPRLAGFYQLLANDTRCELDHLWVTPSFNNRGIGRQLLLHAIDTALQRGATALQIDADPNAEAFYLHCGAVRVDSVSAPIASQPARQRPQLVIALSG